MIIQTIIITQVSFHLQEDKTDPVMAYFNTEDGARSSFEDVAAQLRTNVMFGLSDEEVANRRKNYGYNEFEINDEEPLWKKYLGQVGRMEFLRSVCISMFHCWGQVFLP